MRTTRPWLIRKNLDAIAGLEAEAVRITVGPAGVRCFEMADGRLFTIRNEQPADSDVLHVMAILPLLREDAEDFYGWSPRAVATSVATEPDPSEPVNP